MTISNQTARYDLQGLENSGWIKSTFINKKKKIFSKADNFAGQIKELKKK